MRKEIEFKIPVRKINDEKYILSIVERKIREGKIEGFYILKKSLDARKALEFFLRLLVFIDEPKVDLPFLEKAYQNVENKSKVIVVGAGPAGLFAALQLLEEGLKPIIIERGKDVQERRKDLKAIQQDGIVNPESNYCFGEGGAGTYSDGKLYTRSHKRGKIEKILQILVEHGAKKEILYEAHPHIGSNNLPKIIQSIREEIIKFGGVFHFNTKMVDLVIKNGQFQKIIDQNEKEYEGKALILATGHSARGIYKLLQEKKVDIEAKPFAIGVRIEHSQKLIDKLQYKIKVRPLEIGAADYRLVTQVKDRGVYSFCMCPGGLIVPAATSPGEIVTNGMSLSRRDSPFANSGIVVEVGLDEYEKYKEFGALAGLEYQKSIERRAFEYGDGSQKAPAQRVMDFVNGRKSKTLPETSYIPGIYSAMIEEILPKSISSRLKEALLVFGKKMKGYYSNDAIVVGVETRTSAPVKIPRNRDDFMSTNTKGLFPCGEGAGYAGGILSAAMDGQKVAKAVKEMFVGKPEIENTTKQ